MTITFTTLNGRPLTMRCTLEQFLAGPLMSHLAAIQNDCSPIDLIRDFLPDDLHEAEPEELMERVEEACLLASRYEPPVGPDRVRFRHIVSVSVDDEDRSAIVSTFGLPPVLSFSDMPEPLLVA